MALNSVVKRGLLRQLIATYGNKCQCCGNGPRRGNPLTVDHVVSLNHGGGNSLANLQVLCEDCNLNKGYDDTDYRPFNPFIEKARAQQQHFDHMMTLFAEIEAERDDRNFCLPIAIDR